MYIRFKKIMKIIENYYRIVKPNEIVPTNRVVQYWLKKEFKKGSQKKHVAYDPTKKPREYNKDDVIDMLKTHQIDVNVFEQLKNINELNRKEEEKEYVDWKNNNNNYSEQSRAADEEYRDFISKTENKILKKLILWQFGYVGFNEKNIAKDYSIAKEADSMAGRMNGWDLEDYVAMKNLKNLPLDRYLINKKSKH